MSEQIERELLLSAAAEEVWEVVTASGWLAEEVALELVPGGDASFSSPDWSKTGWVEEAVAPGSSGQTGGRLAFWWASDGDPATRVELTFHPEGETATRLHVIESRPLDVLDATGIPLPGSGGHTYGPAMLIAA